MSNDDIGKLCNDYGNYVHLRIQTEMYAERDGFSCYKIQRRRGNLTKLNRSVIVAGAYRITSGAIRKYILEKLSASANAPRKIITCIHILRA